MSDAHSPSETRTATDGEGFASLSALRAAHSNLLKRYHETRPTPGLLAEVKAFLLRGRATGTILDEDDDRWTCQSLLDYWATMLERSGHEPPDTSLDEFDPDLAPVLPDELCPYRGLDAFQEADSQYFFGRRNFVDQLISHLMHQRLLAVVGPSGCGKSSAVMAGLLPALKSGGLPDSQNWHYLGPMVPGLNPLATLARILRPPGDVLDEWEQAQIEHFQQDPSHLAQLTDHFGEVPVVLIIDQFEEVFTLCHDEAVRRAFVANLLELLSPQDAQPGQQSMVILTMRTDFEPYVARLTHFDTLYVESRLHVPPLSAPELRDAIVQPAEQVGLRLQTVVVEALLQDLLGEPAALPLLQFTLLRLWEERDHNRVTQEAYQRVGGGRLALARTADALYETLIPEDQRAARRILLRIALPGESLEVTRQRVQRKTLDEIGEDPARIERVLDKLIQARLVRLTQSDNPEDAQVEIAHEALLRNWPRLADWLEDERHSIRQRLRLSTAAENWETLGREPGALWGGATLNVALGYENLSELERAFLDASTALRDQKSAQREVRRQRELQQARQLAEEAEARRQVEAERAEEREEAVARLRWRAIVIAVVASIALVAFLFALYMLYQSTLREQEAAAARRAAEAASTRAVENHQVALDSLATQEAYILGLESAGADEATRQAHLEATTETQQATTILPRPSPASGTEVATTPKPSPSPTPTSTPNLAATSQAEALAQQLEQVRATQTALARPLMVSVPAGCFLQGSTQAQIAAAAGRCAEFEASPAKYCPAVLDDELPQHEVCLDEFHIDKYEVSNAQYEACVLAGICSPPQSTESNTRNSYFGDRQYADYPVIEVTWYDASRYCEWLGKRLPTEAEWEKAARGEQGAEWPWGHSFSEGLCNTRGRGEEANAPNLDTSPVGSYPACISPYEAMDMLGNVWEWTADWYGSDYYAKAEHDDPQGPATGVFRVFRGGSWNFTAGGARAAHRSNGKPHNGYIDVGFRCASD